MVVSMICTFDWNDKIGGDYYEFDYQHDKKLAYQVTTAIYLQKGI